MMNLLLLCLVIIAAVNSVQSCSAPTKPLRFSWSPTEQRVGSSRSSLREADFLGDHPTTARPPVAPMRTVHGDWILGGGGLEEEHEEGRHGTTSTIALDLHVAMSRRESPEGDVASLGCFMRRFAAHQGGDNQPPSTSQQDFEAAVRRSTTDEPYRLTLNSSAVLDRCRLVLLRPPSFENLQQEKPQSEKEDEVQIKGEDVLPSLDCSSDQDWWSKWRDKIVPQGSMLWLLQWNHDDQAAPRSSGGSPLNAEEGTRRHIGTMLWTVHALSERAREGEGVWFGEYGAEIRCENLFHCDTDENNDDEDRSLVRAGKALSSHGVVQDGSRQPDDDKEEALRIPLRPSVAVLQLVDTAGNFLPSFSSSSSSAATGTGGTTTRAASVSPSLMGGTRRRRGGGFSAPPVPTMVERSLAADTPDRRTATPFQGILRDDGDDLESGVTAVVDVEEREVRRRGLLWRLSLTNDVFGPFPSNETNPTSFDSMSAGNLAVRSAAFVQKTKLLSRLVCSPLPCLHQNPFLRDSFEVGVSRAKRQLISSSTTSSSLSLGASRFIRHVDGAATTATRRRGALRSHHSSAAAFAILHRALSQVAPLNESTFTDGEARKRWRAAFWEAVARGWREAGREANATRTETPSFHESSSSLLHGMLRRVVVPQDFRVTPSVIHLFIPPRELERRGFSLPAFPRDVVSFLHPFLIAHHRTATMKTTTDEDVIRSEAHSWSTRVLREHLHEELEAFAMYREGRAEDASASSSSKRLHRLLGGGVDLRGLDNEWNREVALVQQRRRRTTQRSAGEGTDLTVDDEKEDSDTNLQQVAEEVSQAQQLAAVGLYRLSLTPFEVIAGRSGGGRRDVIQPLCRKEQSRQAAAQRRSSSDHHRTKEDSAEGCPSADCRSRLLHGGNGRGTSMLLGASYVLPREYFPVTYKLRWMIGENEEARRSPVNEDEEEPLCLADECRAGCSTAVTETADAGSCLQEGDIADGVVAASGLKGGHRRKASGEKKKMRVTMTMSKWCAMQPASPLPPPPPPPRSTAAKESEPPRCPRALLFQGHSGLHPLSGFSAAAHGTCEVRRDILRNLAFLTCPPDDDLEEESEGEAQQQQPTRERGGDVLPHRQSDEDQHMNNNSAAFRRCEDYYGGAETFSQLAWFVAEHWVQGLYVPPTQPRSLWVSFGSSSSPQTAEYDAVSEAHHCGDAGLEIDEETIIGDRNVTGQSTTTTTTTTMVEARRNRKEREVVTTAAWIAFRKPIFVTMRLPMGVIRNHGGLPVLLRHTDHELDEREEVEPSLVRILP